MSPRTVGRSARPRPPIPLEPSPPALGRSRLSPARGLRRRDLLRAGALTAAGAGIAGTLGACASSPSAAIASGRVPLSLWTHDDGYIDFFTEAVPVAEDSSDFTYDVSVTKIGAADLVTKLIAQAVAGTGIPDVAGLEIGAFSRMLRGEIAPELLVDLSEDVQSYADDLIAARLTPFSKDGALYALDSDTPVTVLYHRSDEFDRLGLDPDFGTWEDFAEVGRTLAQNEGLSLGAVAVNDPGGTVQSFHIHLLQRGGDLFDADGNATLQTPEAEEALAFLVDGVQSGFLTTVADMYGPSIQSGLKAGKILAINMPSWYSSYGIQPNVPEQAGQWRVAALPVFEGGGHRTGVGGGTGFGALRDKPATAAARNLVVSAYLDPAQQVKRYKDMGYLPTLRSVYDDPELQGLENEYFGGQKLFEVFRDIVDDVPEFHQSADSSIMTTVLSGHVLRAFKGDVSPAQALADATDDFRGQAKG
ncbi:extracellular solute-binding protein [Brachybacterium sp. NBEC-018]|uniref:extracellular solute-binding protein n=1 Tax=Brachybacterium sp. NBEC-018 TaxID=2996004 RepID=UPI0021755FD4|nr:extracellular solute-binding protein [Brachybacterium sp. NBEC-018]UVY84044.1 extracellular solute-binding protein [Brachybacterium sp. NBEC-018]